MPTKHRRHAITETPEVKEALDPLRAALDAQRLDLSELIVLGAQAKLARLRMTQEDDEASLQRLADRIRSRTLDVEPRLADEAKRSWIRS